MARLRLCSVSAPFCLKDHQLKQRPDGVVPRSALGGFCATKCISVRNLCYAVKRLTQLSDVFYCSQGR